MVLDEAGRPICSESWPATDAKALLPIVTRLRDRFGIRHMCVVADRGMISANTIAELEARGIDYILGARERSSSEIREVVLADRQPMVPLTIPRARGSETDIAVKEVVVGDWGPGTKPRRYVVCFNPAEACRDAAAREATVASLRTKLKAGDKGRQCRISSVPRHAAGRALRNRCRGYRRRCPVRRLARAAHQQHPEHAVGCPGIPRTMAG